MNEELAVLKPAAVLATRVISHPNESIVTVDCGSKSLAAEWGDPAGIVIGHPEYELLKPSEEHLPIRIPPNTTIPNRGDILYIVPKHVCPTVNLAETAIFVSACGVVDEIDIDARAQERFNR